MNEELKKDCKELETQIVRLLEDFYRKHEMNLQVQSGATFHQTKCEMVRTGFHVTVTLHP